MIEKHQISQLAEEMRFDRYLRIIKPSLTQSIIEKNLRKNCIKLNGKRAKSNARVKNGDEIIFYRVADYENAENFKKPEFTEKAKILAEKIQGDYLLYESANLMVINKPSGISSQGGTSVKVSIDDALQYINIKEQNNPVDRFLRILHRLDRETSGVFLIAKNRSTATSIGSMLASRKIEKHYLAVLCGVPRENEGQKTIYLKKDLKSKIQVCTPDGDEAITKFKVLCSNHKYSLVLFKPLTGRMHQIRAFAKYLECSILGDDKYGGENSKHLFLHSIKTKIPKDIEGEEIEIEAEAPEYFQKFVLGNFDFELSKNFNY
jgi:23S rRNA pseudouridine955/2504/2580 synthase